MPHEKGQGAGFSFDNLNHSWLGAVELATFMLERVISQLRGLVGFALGARNLHIPIVLSVLLVLAGYYAGSIVGISSGFPPRASERPGHRRPFFWRPCSLRRRATGGCIYSGWFLPTCTSSPVFSFPKYHL